MTAFPSNSFDLPLLVTEAGHELVFMMLMEQVSYTRGKQQLLLEDEHDEHVSSFPILLDKPEITAWSVPSLGFHQNARS